MLPSLPPGLLPFFPLYVHNFFFSVSFLLFRFLKCIFNFMSQVLGELNDTIMYLLLVSIYDLRRVLSMVTGWKLSSLYRWRWLTILRHYFRWGDDGEIFVGIILLTNGQETQFFSIILPLFITFLLSTPQKKGFWVFQYHFYNHYH